MSPNEDDPLGFAEALLGVVSRAHVAIFRLHQTLVELGVADDGSRALLDESVQIALRSAPATLRGARHALFDEAIEQLLQPSAAELSEAAQVLISETERTLRVLVRRQEQIADELRKRIDRIGG